MKLLVIALATAVFAILLIAGGAFDPQPFGPLNWQQELTPLTLPAQERVITWLPQELPNQPYSLRLLAARERGEADIAYGLVVGDEEAYLAVVVSPLGYLTVWQEGKNCQLSMVNCQLSMMPWQTWPHVRTGEEANEIWLDVAGEQVSIRINRELLWEGQARGLGKQVGVIGESFGETAVVDFRTLKLFTESSPYQ